MRKLIPFVVILLLALWIGCGDDDNGTNGNGPTIVTVTANTTVGAPTLNSVNEPVWDSVTAKDLDMSTGLGPPTVGANVATVATTVSVQAIRSDSMLYLRAVWGDSTLSLWRDKWVLYDKDGFNFTHYKNAGYDEDQLLVMFSGLADSAWDTWRWCSLTTGQVDLAKGMRYYGGDSLLADAGVALSATENHSPPDNSRPVYVHEDKSAFDGAVLFMAEAIPASEGRWDPDWAAGDSVPGWVINGTMDTELQLTPQSRWDIDAIYSYDVEFKQYTVVLARKLNTGYTDDLDMSTLENVTVRIGILDNQWSITAGGSRRAYTADFKLAL